MTPDRLPAVIPNRPGVGRDGRLAIVTALLLLCSFGGAQAEPLGLFFIAGSNPDQSGYEGDVAVTRNGQTYKVQWNLSNGQSPAGFGLAYKNSFAEKCCGDKRVSLMIMEFQNGAWLGQRWDYADRRLGAEVWQTDKTPARPKPDAVPGQIDGRYLIAGTGPDGVTYTGETIVQRDGNQYKLVCVKAGARHTGIMVAFRDSLMIEYDNGATFALMSREGTGQIGVLAAFGGTKVGAERWARAD